MQAKLLLTANEQFIEKQKRKTVIAIYGKTKKNFLTDNLFIHN